MNRTSFFCFGVPIPQGSLRAFVIKGLHPRAVLTHVNRSDLKSWRTVVGECALASISPPCDNNTWPLDAAGYRVTITFYLPRPKSVSVARRPYPNVTPDLDKLTRSVGDALTHILWNDDSSIVTLNVTKLYADHTHAVGADITVETMAAPEPAFLTGLT